jgi:hypothetical protein
VAEQVKAGVLLDMHLIPNTPGPAGDAHRCRLQHAGNSTAAAPPPELRAYRMAFHSAIYTAQRTAVEIAYLLQQVMSAVSFLIGSSVRVRATGSHSQGFATAFAVSQHVAMQRMR